MFASGADAVDRLVARVQSHAPLLPGLGTPRDAVAQPVGLQQLAVGLRVVASVGQQPRAGVGAVQHLLERLAVIDIGRRDLDPADGNPPEIQRSEK